MPRPASEELGQGEGTARWKAGAGLCLRESRRPVWLERTYKGGGESWGQRGDGWLGRAGPSRTLVLPGPLPGGSGLESRTRRPGRVP